MKLIALTLQYQSTKAIRLFAIIAILFLANSAKGQVADSLRKAKPDRRWGIGLTSGIPEKAVGTISYGNSANFLGDGFSISNGNIKHTYYNLGIKLNYNINNTSSICSRYIYNRRHMYAQRTLFKPNNEIGRLDTIIAYQNIHSVYLGYELNGYIQRKFIVSFSPNILFNKYTDVRLYWSTDDFTNNSFSIGKSIGQSGYSIGICAIGAIKYLFAKNFIVGIELPLSISYLRVGNNYKNTTINKINNQIIQTETFYSQTTHFPYISFTPQLLFQFNF